MNILIGKLALQAEIIITFTAFAHMFGHGDVGLFIGGAICVAANLAS